MNIFEKLIASVFGGFVIFFLLFAIGAFAFIYFAFQAQVV